MIQAEGYFASRNPRASMLAGSLMFRADPVDGLAVARFCWADVDTHYASNTRTSAKQLLGFAYPLSQGSMIRVARGQRYVRPGLAVTIMAGGDYWVRFRNGAQAGERVYAFLVDGSANSGEAGAAEATPWYVATDAAPGGLAIISTTSRVTA